MKVTGGFVIRSRRTTKIYNPDWIKHLRILLNRSKQIGYEFGAEISNRCHLYVFWALRIHGTTFSTAWKHRIRWWRSQVDLGPIGCQSVDFCYIEALRSFAISEIILYQIILSAFRLICLEWIRKHAARSLKEGSVIRVIGHSGPYSLPPRGRYFCGTRVIFFSACGWPWFQLFFEKGRSFKIGS